MQRVANGNPLCLEGVCTAGDSLKLNFKAVAVAAAA